jgi:hypothetical protein
LIVMEKRFEPKILENRAFVLMFLFGFAGIVIYYLEEILMVTLRFPTYHLQVLIIYLTQGYAYLLSPVILFISFYKLCGRNIPERMASTLISLVLGVLAGILSGGFVMSGVATLTLNISYAQALTRIPLQITYTLISPVLFALAAVALTFVVKRWDEMLTAPGVEWKFEKRPLEVSLASGIYIGCGILTLCVLPILFLSPFSFELDYLVLELGIIVLVVIAGIGQLIIGRGIYKGRRWAWMVALIGSLLSLALNIEVLAIFALAQVKWDLIERVEVVTSLISLFLGAAVLGLIFTHNSRVYCRMVDVHLQAID